MSTYLLLFVGQPAQSSADDPETQAYHAQWGEYMAGLGQRGALLSGLPLEPTGKVVAKSSVTELELQPVDVGGFLVVRAETEAEAVEIASGAPHIALGGTTIVRPCIELPAPPG
jgi:hypothetical protein